MGAGPESLIEAGIDSALAADDHSITTTLIEVPPDSWTSEIATAFELMRCVAAAIKGTKTALPVVLAGSCITTIGGLATYPPSRRGVVWLGPRADFHNP